MANYNSLQDLVSSTVNLTQDFSGSEDDGSRTFSISSGFTWNGYTITSVTASGNSWVTYNNGSSESYSIKVNRRDTKMTAFYHETGTVSGLKFLRLRWQGYPHYSASTLSLIYDIVLCENQRFYLHIANWNVGSYGTGYTCICYSGSNYAQFTMPGSTLTNYDYTFYPTTEGDITSFTYKIGLDVLQTKKYLVRDTSDNKVYTRSSGSWVEVTDNVALAATWQTYGLEELPTDLPSSFELLKCVDTGDVGTVVYVVADVNATADDNSIYMHSVIPGIVSILAIVKSTDGNVYYSNDNLNWFSQESLITDLSDFYIKVDLSNGTYFEDIKILYE